MTNNHTKIINLSNEQVLNEMTQHFVFPNNLERGDNVKINKQRLQIAMANACLNMDDLATLAGISRVSLTKYVSGSTKPRTKTVGKIAKALNVQVQDIIELESD